MITFSHKLTHGNIELSDALNAAFAEKSGGGLRVTVAASNASDSDKDRADYTADGVSDSATIQAAVDAVASTNGTVDISVGLFTITTPILISSNVTVRGSGWGTRLKSKVNLNDYVFKFVPPAGGLRVEISDMEIDCQGDLQTSDGGGIKALGAIQCLFNHLHIDTPFANGIYCYGDGSGGTGHHNRIVNCLIDHGEDSNGGDGRAILFQASDENYVLLSDFESNGRWAASEPNHIYDRSGLQQVIGCVFVGGSTGLKFEQYASRAIGNIFDGCRNHHVRLNGDQNIVANNYMLNIGFGHADNSIDGVWVDNVKQNVIHDNIFRTYVPTAGARSGINCANGASENDIHDNRFYDVGQGFGQSRIIPGTGNFIRQNRGYYTEKTGTAVVANGATTVVVNHGLNATPLAANISVTPTNNLGNATKFWVTTLTSSQFTINVDADPGAGTATFSWQAVLI